MFWLAGANPSAAAATHSFLGLTNWSQFHRSSDRAGLVLESTSFESPFPADILIPSWNVSDKAALTIEARPARPGSPAPSRWYSFGSWALNTNLAPRSSVSSRGDVEGRVETDTLVLAEPARHWQVRLTFHRGDPRDDLQFLGLCWSRRGTGPPVDSADFSLPDLKLEVPVRSQADYPEGVQSWCSPTSTAMLLAWWGDRLGRPELRVPVPEVAAGVDDPGWPGTGNWPFNTAYAATFPGIRAFVTRLDDLAELEALLRARVPVAASVSYALLKGAPAAERGDGHLVVVTGFAPPSEIRINDPGVRRDRVQRLFAVANFIRAWRHSDNTVYVLHPTTVRLPVSLRGHW